jgi:hypothetical protein
MRRPLLVLAALTVALLAVPAQAADPWSIFNINGNDTGGIIPWSPELRAYGYREAAQHHCGGYLKVARITSVHPRYGDYVGFACEFQRGYDPVKRGDWWYNWPHF